MLGRIEEIKPRLRKSEQKVADIVLARPNSVVQESIAVLAADAAVSEPTVIRFCRALGCDGFQDFKLKLAQSLASGVRYFHRDVLPGDPTPDLIGKIFDGAIAGLVQVRNNLSADAVQRSIALLSNAIRIEFYGHGASGVVALDAHHKFFRLGVPVAAYSDPHVHCMSAALLQSGSVVVAISYSGRNLELLQSVEIARRSGADIIGVTASGSPLAELSTEVLPVDVREDTDNYAPIKARIAHLSIIDVLAVGVALRRGPELLKRLDKAARSLKDKFVDVDKREQLDSVLSSR